MDRILLSRFRKYPMNTETKVEDTALTNEQGNPVTFQISEEALDNLTEQDTAEINTETANSKLANKRMSKRRASRLVKQFSNFGRTANETQPSNQDNTNLGTLNGTNVRIIPTYSRVTKVANRFSGQITACRPSMM